MSSIDLSALSHLDGLLGACLVDSDSGLILNTMGNAHELDLAAAGDTEVLRAERKSMSFLDLEDDIEDILISLKTQYQLIRPLGSNSALFLYVVLDRSRANLGMARLILKKVEMTLDLS